MGIDLTDISLALYMDVMERGKFLHIEMNRALEKYDHLKRNEKAFIKRLVTGSVERCISIDATINAFSKVKVKKMKPLIRSVLRLFTYQIIYMDSVTDYTAVNEAVKLTKKHGFATLSGFVNAVLRNILRGRESVVLSKREKLEMPESIWNLLSDQYAGRAEDIAKSFLESDDKGIIIRVNKSRGKEDIKDLPGIREICKEMGCFALSATGNVATLPGFEEGRFIIQDTASCLPVYLSGVKPGDTVLELCSAPGGKTVQICDMMNDEGILISRDISAERCLFIEDNLERCGFKICSVECADACDIKEEDTEKYDICFVDAPCSGLGVIGTKPDIRFHFDAERLGELTDLQKNIVASAVKTVKKGGLLVYSTCTLNKAENEEVIRYAMSLRPSETVDVSQSLPSCFKNFEINENMITIFPRKNICEGFFAGILKMN